ncbi:MAG: amidohydrolase [Pirellulales bacterium]|nr:amidohydrolase [Pirellulales bacterium]
MARRSIASSTDISRSRTSLLQGTKLRVLAVASLLVLTVTGSQRLDAQEPTPPVQWISAGDHLSSLFELYQHLHQTPELSYEEVETGKRIGEELRSLGFDVTNGVGGHGVVGVLKNGEGPTVMVRTDLDALPVTEETNLVYASKVRVTTKEGVETGVMHACGHDIHMTSFIGTARYLAGNKDLWSGTLVFIGQPAEERGAGAKAMLDDGLFERFPRPDYALALHVDSALDSGKIGYTPGYALANVDSVDIIVHGRGGHGAYPHTTVDPIVQAAQLVMALQTIVSREVSPIDSAVVTVGAIHAGAKHNVIPNQCHLQLTVRSYKDETREHVLNAIRRKARGIAEASNAPEPEITISEGTPAMKNDAELVERLLPSWRATLGEDNVVPAQPQMGGEDFSHYGLAGVPIFMFRLGSVETLRLSGYERIGQPPPSLHSSVYYPDAELSIRTGVVATSTAVLDLIGVEK